jgi:glycosyltransferase involved in cell wall biosynthesis
VIVLVCNFDADPAITDAEQLLAQYATLTGWSSALLGAGAGRVAVLQTFRRDLTIVRNGVEYVFASTMRQAWRTIRRLKPHLAHVNGLRFPGQTAALRLLLPRNTAVVIQDHASGAPGAGRAVGRLVLRGALRQADGFLFTALEQAEPWRAAGLITSRQSVHAVLEASTTLTPIARAAAREMSRVAGDPAVLWVGRLNANKDPLTVLQGFQQALARLPGAGLTMVFGEGDLLNAVRTRIQGSGSLGRHVSLVGRVPHHLMASYYSAADLFVLGSHHEGSGYALIEALACGVVPVVTSIPSFRTITGNGSLGSLWPPGDASRCAEALIGAARDSQAQRAHVLDEFNRRLSWPAVGRQALAAYADIIARRAVH